MTEDEKQFYDTCAVTAMTEILRNHTGKLRGDDVQMWASYIAGQMLNRRIKYFEGTHDND